MDNLYFLVKNNEGKYLRCFLGNDNLSWAEREFAWHYVSNVAFADAQQVNGKVFLIFPSGREVEVFEKDFEKC